MSRGQNSITVKANLTGLKQMLGAIAQDIDEAVRPASQAAAQVFYDAVKQNVRSIGKKTGNLERSIYQVFSQDNSNPKKATYHISWNARIAPHGGLVEYGHVQRYMAYINPKGEWKTAIRPEMQGKPRPKRRAPQAVKDAYYMPRPGGPQMVAARPFVRPALDKTPQALAAAEAVIYKIVMGGTYER